MRALIVIVGLLVLLPLDAVAGGRRDKIAIVDANGRQVGTVVGARIADFTIALSVNGRHALLDVVSSESIVFPGLGAFAPIQGVDAALLLTFESRDCSGTPFLYQPPDRLFDWAVVAPPGMTLYLPETAGMAPRTIQVGSFLGALGGCQIPGPLTTPADPESTAYFVPAAAVVDLLTLFTPPFRLAFTD
ncbi:MAG TPA: hypothetical protein VK548_22245 [Candidatus Acidoferrum sp.]|nr:hypothetical protein [Candidatus Acidoferrum sp.]